MHCLEPGWCSQSLKGAYKYHVILGKRPMHDGRSHPIHLDDCSRFRATILVFLQHQQDFGMLPVRRRVENSMWTWMYFKLTPIRGYVLEGGLGLRLGELRYLKYKCASERHAYSFCEYICRCPPNRRDIKRHVRSKKRHSSTRKQGLSGIWQRQRVRLHLRGVVYPRSQ